LFYEFSLEQHVPGDHLLRAIDRFVDLDGFRAHLAPFYSTTGRPSIDPELMIRMLIVGYCSGIRSERRLGEEVHLNLAYRWFCRLGLDGEVPDHSTFSKRRHGRFRDADLLRQLFETIVRRCMAEGLAVAEYLATLDHAPFGAATPVEAKSISPLDPAASLRTTRLPSQEPTTAGGKPMAIRVMLERSQTPKFAYPIMTVYSHRHRARFIHHQHAFGRSWGHAVPATAMSQLLFGE
jgi:transposase